MASGGVLGDGTIERLGVNRAQNDQNDQNGALKAAKRPKTDQKYLRTTAHLQRRGRLLYHLTSARSLLSYERTKIELFKLALMRS